MDTQQTPTDELNEDRNFLMMLLGMAMLLSCLPLVVGIILDETNKNLIWLGDALILQGWVWISGTFMMGLFIRARMNAFRKEMQLTSITKN